MTRNLKTFEKSFLKKFSQKRIKKCIFRVIAYIFYMYNTYSFNEMQSKEITYIWSVQSQQTMYCFTSVWQYTYQIGSHDCIYAFNSICIKWELAAGTIQFSLLPTARSKIHISIGILTIKPEKKINRSILKITMIVYMFSDV